MMTQTLDPVLPIRQYRPVLPLLAALLTACGTAPISGDAPPTKQDASVHTTENGAATQTLPAAPVAAPTAPDPADAAAAPKIPATQSTQSAHPPQPLQPLEAHPNETKRVLPGAAAAKSPEVSGKSGQQAPTPASWVDQAQRQIEAFPTGAGPTPEQKAKQEAGRQASGQGVGTPLPGHPLPLRQQAEQLRQLADQLRQQVDGVRR